MISRLIILGKKYKKIAGDFIINILASGVLTAVLQLLVYPLLANEVSASVYGIILTVMGIQNTIINALGNALNNVRLIQNDKYALQQNGDFNIILLFATIAAVIIDFFIFKFIFLQPNRIVVGLIIFAVLGIMRLYYSTAFRIVLDLKFVLYCNCFTSIGYLLGIILYLILPFWPGIFILGELLGVLFLLKKSFLFDFSIKRSGNFRATLKKYRDLCGSTAIGSALTYMDRLIILPILGAGMVSTYTVASIVGKTLGIVMLPIAGVMLSYYSQRGFTMGKNEYIKVTSLCTMVCAVFYICTLLFGQIVINIFYPSLAKDASGFMWIANLAAIIAILGNMLSPTVIKFSPSIWQIIITGTYAILYGTLSIFLSMKYNLMGFCIASTISNIYRAVVMMIVGYVGVRNVKKEL